MRLIIHHWDTDGIAAAALLYEKDDSNMSPKIGNYFLEEDEFAMISVGNYDEIVVVDVALHPDTMKRLAEITKVRVFDHHITKRVEGIEYINPILDGKDEEDYPSASWVVADYLNRRDELLAFLGVVGDWEERIKNTRFFPLLDEFMKKNGFTFEELHEMVYLMDSNYKAGDKEEVEKAVRELKTTPNPADYIMNNSKWRRRKEEIEREIEDAINGKEERIGKAVVKRIKSKYNIISTVARKIWKGDEYVIVINCDFFRDDCQVYVRGEDATPFIKMAAERGYVSGGKKNVMGAIVPKNECDEFVEKILEKING
ncbi:MAG: DHH family phosphoesterase [Thermoplasmata archaeon]|nr:DHH family phosphoesterase [Thermoplasmata archaeon]